MCKGALIMMLKIAVYSLNGNKCSTFEFVNGTGLADFIYLYIYFQNVMYDIYSKFTTQQAGQTGACAALMSALDLD